MFTKSLKLRIKQMSINSDKPLICCAFMMQSSEGRSTYEKGNNNIFVFKTISRSTSKEDIKIIVGL